MVTTDANSIRHFIADFSPVPLVVTCVIGVARYRRLNLTRRYLVWLSLLALVITAITFWLRLYKHPNLFLFPVDTAIEFTFLALMYRRALWPMAVSRYLPVVIGVFLLGSAFSFNPDPNSIEFSAVQHFIESVMVLVLVVLYFRRIIKPPGIPTPLEYEPMFWVSAGLLLYFGASALIFLTSNITLPEVELSRNLWAIHAVFYALLNVFYIVALSVNPRPTPEVTQT